MAGAELITLFGDQLPQVHTAKIGIRVAGGTKVSARDLANTLLALSVVDLVSQGVATLERKSVKGKFRTRESLVVRSSPGGEGFSALIAGKAGNGVEIAHLAYQVLGNSEAVGTEMKLLGIAQSFLEQSGAVRAPSQKLGWNARHGGATPYEINDDVAATLLPHWQPLRASWENFGASRAGDLKELIDLCSKSIAECRPSLD